MTTRLDSNLNNAVWFTYTTLSEIANTRSSATNNKQSS